MLAPPDPAPAFDLADDGGNRVRLEDLRGRWVVLYFYPKDDTPGCTTQACGFRDAEATMAKRGVVVLGVSPDNVASHRAFKEKFGLPFPLLSDPDKEVARAFGAWGLKRMYGREYEGILRTTFVIDPQGRIAHVFKNVKPKGHAEAVLAILPA